MDWKETLKPRIWTFIFMITLVFLVQFISSYYMKIGGVAYYSLPFHIKVTSCGSWLGAAQNCTYPWIWSGILLSLIFWIAIYALFSFIVNRYIKK